MIRTSQALLCCLFLAHGISACVPSDEEGTAGSGGNGSASGGAQSASGGQGAVTGGTTGAGDGGATGDGGSGGTEGTGGSTGGPGVGCAGADIVCDDFEGGTIDAAKWRVVAAMAGGVEPVLDSSKGHDSSASVRFEDVGGVGRFLTSQAAFPDGGELYVRTYMNFANPTVDMSGHTGFIVGATADSNGQELRWGQSAPGCNAPNQLLDLNHIPSDATICSSGHITGGNPADAPDPDGVTLDADTWYCVETFWDTNVGEFRIWIDGEELSVLHATADSWCPIGQEGCDPPSPWPIDFQLVKFGTQVYNGGAGDIWYDDVAFATQRIGCE